MKRKIFLHACCAPCSTAVIEKIKETIDADITVFYYNPNISPADEELKRFDELKKFIDTKYLNDVALIRGEYDYEKWSSLVAPLAKSGEGGMRCRICYYLRLLETFRKAVETGADLVTTTLSISPYKNFEWLDEIGRLLSAEFGIEWFLEKWDYKRSIELSSEFGLYRQKYCGCEFSRLERESKKKKNRNSEF